MTLRRLILCLLTWMGAASAGFAMERTEFMPQGDLIGTIERHEVKHEDTLYDIARRYKVGLVQLMAANPGVDAWVPPPGRELVIPTRHILPPGPRQGVVINLSELRLFYYASPDKVYSYPIGIGREGWQTPKGRTSITRKRKDPVWIPPASIRKENPDLPAMVPAGPNNPLGAYAMNLGWASYTIHGTDKPDGIGRRSSHGCIRMYPEDIEELFGLVREGTPVTVLDTSHKLGWSDEVLYLEVNPTQEQSDAIMEYEHVVPLDIPGLEGEIAAAVKDRGLPVDWQMVRTLTASRAGIPLAIAGDGRALERAVLPQAPPARPVQKPAPEHTLPAVPPSAGAPTDLTPRELPPADAPAPEPEQVPLTEAEAPSPGETAPEGTYRMPMPWEPSQERPMRPVPPAWEVENPPALDDSRYRDRGDAPPRSGSGVSVYWQ